MVREDENMMIRFLMKNGQEKMNLFIFCAIKRRKDI